MFSGHLFATSAINCAFLRRENMVAPRTKVGREHTNLGFQQVAGPESLKDVRAFGRAVRRCSKVLHSGLMGREPRLRLAGGWVAPASQGHLEMISALLLSEGRLKLALRCRW